MPVTTNKINKNISFVIDPHFNNVIVFFYPIIFSFVSEIEFKK